jgi:2-methylcitrate dehydratase PrpD
MIDGVRDLRARVAASRRLTRLDLRVSVESMQLMSNADPANELEAKFSLLYEAAVAWIEGHVTPAAFEAEAVRDPRYRSVMALTRITPSPEVAQHEALIEAAFEDGSVEHLHVEHARGTPARPLTDRDLMEKFVAALALGGLPEGASLGERILTEPNMPVSRLMEHVTEPS